MSEDISTSQRGRSDTASGQLPDDFRAATEALIQATNQLTLLLQRTHTGSAAGPIQAGQVGQAATTPQINIWEDDPFSEAVPTTNPRLATPIAVDLPQNNNPRLQTTIVGTQPAPARYSPGTANFRYWATAEAVARGINFWTSLLPPGTTWSTSNPMRITLVAGTDLNANYSRAAGLRFYEQVVQNMDIFSGESPDVACHELGHAILDALKPQLFNAANVETGAFHEAMGDMSAILCALQLPSVRSKLLSETGGRLDTNSRISRLAEQLGWAIRQLAPTAVDRDCLRNAANRFAYRPPNTLPPTAPAVQLSSEVHSFSRVFTGAFLDALQGMFRTLGAPTDANLLTVSRDMGQLLVDGVHTAPITSAYFSSVAAAMIQADKARNGGKYVKALTTAFVGRAILAVHSAMDVTNAPAPQEAPANTLGMGPAGMAAAFGSSTFIQYPGMAPDEAYKLGHGETPELPVVQTSLGPLQIGVHKVDSEASDVFGFAAVPAVFGQVDRTPVPAEEAARSFLEDLIQTGRLDLSAAKDVAGDLSHDVAAKTTHTLVPDPQAAGALVLKRKHFECGFCAPSTSPRMICQ